MPPTGHSPNAPIPNGEGTRQSAATIEASRATADRHQTASRRFRRSRSTPTHLCRSSIFTFPSCFRRKIPSSMPNSHSLVPRPFNCTNFDTVPSTHRSPSFFIFSRFFHRYSTRMPRIPMLTQIFLIFVSWAHDCFACTSFFRSIFYSLRRRPSLINKLLAFPTHPSDDYSLQL